MKSIKYMAAAAMILGMAGCATSPVVLAPVGPNPSARADKLAMGQLEVFSATEQNSDEYNHVWFQRTDYDIYNLSGGKVKHVFNAVALYKPAPRVVALPPGRYIVEAEGRDALRVKVPVEIERGRTSRIHLDDNWQPPATAPRDELVSMPSGSLVGWRADATNMAR
jgi:hypothetical protein